MEKMALTHLRALEAESVHILREVVAEFAKPVMLYSIGKDSSVMVRLAQKAFFPGKVPFPLLHIDTTYKFREMIEFRDRFTREMRSTPAPIPSAWVRKNAADSSRLGPYSTP
jgi:sulfate adenylyltransferase subunit 2